MPFFEVEIADLFARELRTEQRSGVFPLLAVRGENAVAQTIHSNKAKRNVVSLVASSRLVRIVRDVCGET